MAPSKPIPRMYVVTIEDWDAYYHFGLANRANEGSGYDAYSEIRSLTLNGKLHNPDSPKLKHGMAVEIKLHHEPKELLKDVESAAAIGMVQLNDNRLDFFIRYPGDAYSGLVSLLNSGKVKAAVIVGTELYRKAGSVRGFELNTVFNPEEY